jgi:hypothetical protein
MSNISVINNGKESRIFEYRDIKGEFKEIELEDNSFPLYELRGQDFILLFIDHKRKRVWMWIGLNCSPKMKFKATQASYQIRDRYAFSYRITTVDEGNESIDFKIFIGLKEEEEDIHKEVEPQYIGTVEQDELLEFMSEEQILRILEKAKIPDGYERRMVIVNNEIYLYKEYPQTLGADIKQKRLFKRKEEVEDGWILLEDYTPRILFSFNNIMIIELLQKTLKKKDLKKTEN